MDNTDVKERLVELLMGLNHIAMGEYIEALSRAICAVEALDKIQGELGTDELIFFIGQDGKKHADIVHKR